MIIPKNETRKFKLGKMSNKIKYVLIHNKNIDKTQICVNVKIGSSMDPLNNMGLAHFLEHMLFMGNKKYPKEDFFDSHLKKYGGYSNAYTDTFATVYFFQCNNQGINIAADCFSEFFKTPLFSKSSVNREINAINSEHSKNLKQDMWRLIHFIRMNSKKDSILNKFYTGNLDSFDNNVRNDMINFYKKYYVSENITLTVQSNLSIEKIEKLLEPFRNIPLNKSNKLVFSIKKPLFNKINTLSHLESTSDNYKMVVYYEIDYTTDTFKTMSHSLITDLLNLNHETSLRQLLINKKLVSEFYAFHLSEGIMFLYFELFSINNISEIIKIVTNYFNFLLKSSKINSFIKESKKIYKILFDNSEVDISIDIITSLSTNLHLFSSKYFYAANSIIFEDTKTVKKDIIKQLKSFKNHKIILYHRKNLDKMKLKDKPYQMKYIHDNYSSFINSTKLVGKIKFDIDITEITEPTLFNIKNMIKPIQEKNIYYITNKSFKEPLIYLKVYYKLPETIINSVSEFCNIKLMLKYFNEIINISMHQLLKMNTSVYFSLNIFSSRIILNISTFNNLLLPIFKKLDEIISIKKINKIILNKVKKNLIDTYLSMKNATPWDLINYMVQNSFYENIFSIENILGEFNKINNIKPLDFNILEKNVFMVGNFNSSQLTTVVKKFKSSLKPEKILTDIKFSNKIFNISNKLKQVCYSHNYIFGKYDTDKMSLLILLVNIVESKFFNIFRTKKQYGYRVGIHLSKIIIRNNVVYSLSLKIQTEKNISKLKQELLDFVNEIPNLLEKVVLATYQHSLMIRLKEPIKNTSELFRKYDDQILYQTNNFDKKEKLIKAIKKINKNKLIKFIHKYLIEQKPVIFKVVK
tara:strand:+ start:814 stop:3402 length:2589 start_codon:yes stop_codon:yes gene_type:complete